MSRQKKNRRPDPNLAGERQDRRNRQDFKKVQIKMRNAPIGGVSLDEDPFGILEELEWMQYQVRR